MTTNFRHYTVGDALRLLSATADVYLVPRKTCGRCKRFSPHDSADTMGVCLFAMSGTYRRLSCWNGLFIRGLSIAARSKLARRADGQKVGRV